MIHSSDETFKNFIQENSEHLKEALEKHERRTSRTDSIDVAANKIIETSSHTATPTKIKASLRRILGETTNVVSGV